MSLESFKEEFYFVEADQVSPKHAIQHALLKWTGILPENLEKHGVQYVSHGVRDKDESVLPHLTYSSPTCSLCHLYLMTSDDATCKDCPLAMVRNGVSCDRSRDSDPSPYNYDQPYRMIEFLGGALELYGPKPDFVSPTLIDANIGGDRWVWATEGNPFEYWACSDSEKLFPNLAVKRPSIKIEMYDWWYPGAARFDLCVCYDQIPSFKQCETVLKLADTSLFLRLVEGVRQALGLGPGMDDWKGSVWIRPVIVEP